jgi:hypothetical protein
MGWGNVLDKVFNWIPKREEARRNTIEKLEKEQDEIQKRPETPANVLRLDAIAKQLSKLYKDAKNN